MEPGANPLYIHSMLNQYIRYACYICGANFKAVLVLKANAEHSTSVLGSY